MELKLPKLRRGRRNGLETAPPTAINAAPGPTSRRDRLRKVRRTAVGDLTVALAVLLAIYALALYVLRPDTAGQRVPLDVVLRAANERTLREVRFLDQDARITGIIAARGNEPSLRFTTSYPKSDAATNDLLKTFYSGGARITVDSQSTKQLVRFLAQYLLPLLILADLFALLFAVSRSGGGGTKEFSLFARLGDKRLSGKGSATFADVAAAEEAVTELVEIRDFLADRSAFERMGAQPPKGILLVGPPGCGKTLLARAVAGEAQATFFSVSGSEFVESLVGVGAARVRDLFTQARASTPAILFIDELDAVGRQRGAGVGGGHDEREQTLNELLVQMDGFSPAEGVVVMAATNRPDILDPALLRPGRFDRQVTVERPDTGGRLDILRLHAKGKRLADPTHDLPDVAAATPGFTGADLANVLNEAALLAVRARDVSVGRTHLDEAVERVVAGPRRRATRFSPEDTHRIAVHESGHAVVAAALGRTESIDRLSIISRGRGIGHLALLTENTVLPTRGDMETTITIAMAGIAAEELLLGEPSIGAEADLQRATAAARDMAGRFGMSERLGRVRVLSDQQEVFLGRDFLHTREVSQPTLEHLDAEVSRILTEQEQRARSILVQSRSILEALAQELVVHETLRGFELQDILAGVPQLGPWGSRAGVGAERA